MIEIREYQDGDLECARQNPLDEALKAFPALPRPEKPCFTGLVNGQVVGVGGIVTLWSGVGEAWIVLTKDILQNKVESYRCILRMFKKMTKENYHRIQATVRVDFPQAIKMVEHLGFKREGKLIAYCPDGEDSFIYAITR